MSPYKARWADAFQSSRKGAESTNVPATGWGPHLLSKPLSVADFCVCFLLPSIAEFRAGGSCCYSIRNHLKLPVGHLFSQLPPLSPITPAFPFLA